MRHWKAMSTVYLKAGDLRLSLSMLGQALAASKDPSWCLEMLKRVARHGQRLLRHEACTFQ
jgi:hypothetical protein